MLYQYVDVLAGAQPIETARLICEAGLSEPRENALLFEVARRWFAQRGASILDTPALNQDGLERCRWPVFAAVANELPLEALPRVMKLTDDALRARVFINLIMGANGPDLDAVLEAMLMLAPNERATVLRLVGGEIASKDPERTIEWLENLTPDERKALGPSVFEMIAQREPKRALQLVESGAFPDDLAIIETALFALSQSDPAAALAYLDRFDDVEMRTRLSAEVLRGWSGTDPEAAAHWLVSLEPEASPGGYQELAHTWGRSDLDAALEFVDLLPQPVQSLWILSLAEQVLEQRPDRYLSWAAQFRTERFYPHLAAQFPLSMDDADAAEAVVMSMEPSVRTEGLQGLILRYETGEPARAATWVVQIAEESVRTANALRVASYWAREDPAAATAWAQSLPAGSLKDAALSGVVASLPDSLDLADQISNRETRITALLGAGTPQDLATRLVLALKQISLDERQWTALEANARQTHGKDCTQCTQYPVMY